MGEGMVGIVPVADCGGLGLGARFWGRRDELTDKIVDTVQQKPPESGER